MPGAPGQPSPTRATVQLADGPVTILPKRAPVGNSGPIRGRSLAIFPMVTDLSGRWRASAASRVEPGGRPARALLDLTEAEAIGLAHELGLDEILFWDGRRAHILTCR